MTGKTSGTTMKCPVPPEDARDRREMPGTAVKCPVPPGRRPEATEYAVTTGKPGTAAKCPVPPGRRPEATEYTVTTGKSLVPPEDARYR